MSRKKTALKAGTCRKTDKTVYKPEPLILIEEGEYLVKPLESRKKSYMGKRLDLAIDFVVLSPEYAGLKIPGFWQVKWTGDDSFLVGPKSNFFRMYQECFGKCERFEFQANCLEGAVYRAKIINVDTDSRGQPLHPVNHYSRVSRLHEIIQDDDEELSFGAEKEDSDESDF